MNASSLRQRFAGVALASAALTVMTGAAGAAGIPDSLAKLKGSSASKAGDAFTRAGYQMQGEKERWDRKDSFWWHQKSRQCLRLTTRLGIVSGVATVGESDCTIAPQAGGVIAARPGTLVAADLLGLSRNGGEAKLAAAGFNAVSIDERPEASYTMWFNQHTGQCIGANVIGNHFDVAQDLPTNKCR